MDRLNLVMFGPASSNGQAVIKSLKTGSTGQRTRPLKPVQSEWRDENKVRFTQIWSDLLPIQKPKEQAEGTSLLGGRTRDIVTPQCLQGFLHL